MLQECAAQPLACDFCASSAFHFGVGDESYLIVCLFPCHRRCELSAKSCLMAVACQDQRRRQSTNDGCLNPSEMMFLS